MFSYQNDRNYKSGTINGTGLATTSTFIIYRRSSRTSRLRSRCNDQTTGPLARELRGLYHFIGIKRQESQICSTIRPEPYNTDFSYENRQSKLVRVSTQFTQHE
ncbi:hypothetical protein T06_329 [Trichinella sp. T6]|nr:hypothetical protein T06_11169 [Trichinella sp. T6]KRX72991.1 hypothetical protein T06_12294 [Trichinella sp. T6]KRX82162.1 hypothetical protein T06_329 [Trichinella sp. T6]